jgi:hypothetical protein
MARPLARLDWRITADWRIPEVGKLPGTCWGRGTDKFRRRKSVKILRQWLNAQYLACDMQADVVKYWDGLPNQRQSSDELLAFIEKADQIIPVLLGFALESAAQ